MAAYVVRPEKGFTKKNTNLRGKRKFFAENNWKDDVKRKSQIKLN